ncbi:MAG: hypothetical protein ACRCU2_19525, partial [Planktothrix sp.]
HQSFRGDRLEEITPPNGHPLPLHPSPMIKAGVPILTLLLQSLDNLSEAACLSCMGLNGLKRCNNRTFRNLRKYSEC